MDDHAYEVFGDDLVYAEDDGETNTGEKQKRYYNAEYAILGYSLAYKGNIKYYDADWNKLDEVDGYTEDEEATLFHNERAAHYNTEGERLGYSEEESATIFHEARTHYKNPNKEYAPRGYSQSSERSKFSHSENNSSGSWENRSSEDSESGCLNIVGMIVGAPIMAWLILSSNQQGKYLPVQLPSEQYNQPHQPPPQFQESAKEKRICGGGIFAYRAPDGATHYANAPMNKNYRPIERCDDDKKGVAKSNEERMNK